MRIRPGTRREIGWVNAGIVRVLGLATGGRPPNVFTTLGRGKLPRAETELVILRVAHNSGCEYEWGQLGKAAERA